jgi:cell wall-associated NlpC family hydrolase
MTRMMFSSFAVLLPLMCLAQTRPTTVEIRRGIELPTTDPADRQQAVLEQIVRRIEPDLKGDVSRLAVYVDFWKRESVRDPRLFAADVSARIGHDQTIELRGFVENRAHAHSLELLLRTLGFKKIDNQIEALADSAMCFGVVISARAFVYDRVAEPRESVTQVLAGEPVFILRSTDDGYCWIHGADGYVGFVQASQLKQIGREELTALLRRPDGEDRSPKIEGIVAAASKLIGTPYVWGGRTSAGIDCSGLTQGAYQSQGISLPRDADQQAYVGKMVAISGYRDAMSRGDLMFFISRRGTISHVAIYLGDNQFIEAADSGVKISSLNSKNPNYEPKRDRAFAFARRVIE